MYRSFIVGVVAAVLLGGCDYFQLETDPEPRGALQFDPVSLDESTWITLRIADASTDCWGMRRQDNNLVIYRDKERAECQGIKCTPLDHMVLEISSETDLDCPEIDYQGLRLRSCRVSAEPDISAVLPTPTVVDPEIRRARATKEARELLTPPR